MKLIYNDKMLVSSNGVGGEISTTKEHKRDLAEKEFIF